MKELFEQYEARRHDGLHRGPPITALRAYEFTWPIESGAANRDRPASRDSL